MTSRWKRIATRTVQTFAQCEAGKHRNSAADKAGTNKPGLSAVSGIPLRHPHGAGGAAPAVAALVMRCLKGGGA